MHLTWLEWLNPAHAALLKSAPRPSSAQPARPREEFCRPSMTCGVTGSHLAPVLWLDVETELGRRPGGHPTDKPQRAFTRPGKRQAGS